MTPPETTSVDELAQRIAGLRARVGLLGAYLDPAALAARQAELEDRMQEPGFWDDPQVASRVSAEHAAVRDRRAEYEELAGEVADLDDLIEVAKAGDEGEAFVQELADGLQRVEAQLARLEESRLFSGEHDGGDAVMTINAGEGGTDAQDWAEMLMRMYMRWAEARGFAADIKEIQEGAEAGIKSVTMTISGPSAYGLTSAERGVHRLVRLSPFDSAHRRQTSFAAVDVAPLVSDDVAVEIDDKDLKVDTYRASGAGGQHVNKTESAVRLTHIPTNIVVYCQTDRSQHRNRAQAWQMLRARLYELELKRREEQAAIENAGKTDIGFGHQIRSYVLQPYQMVKDLRTGVATSDTGGVLDGDLDPFMHAALAQKAFGGGPKDIEDVE